MMDNYSPNRFRYAVSGALVALALLSACDATMVVLHSDSSPNSTAPMKANMTVLHNAGGKGWQGYLTVFSHAAAAFGVRAATSDCVGSANTSVQAQRDGCLWATNAGPFNMKTGQCSGVVIADDELAAADWNTTDAMFASTRDGKWVLGSVTKSEAEYFGVTNLVTGFGWLVQDGKSMVTTRGGEVAPRTAVGVDAQGRLVVLVVDGCEKCKPAGGLTMFQLAKMMADAGVAARYAINLDGGGSTTLVHSGSVVDFPTCVDIDLKVRAASDDARCV